MVKSWFAQYTNRTMLIDCHSHLHVKEFDADREAAIQRAKAAGVGTLINVGFEVEGNFQALALAKKYDDIYATMGIHPHAASEWDEEVGEKIGQTVKREEKIVALGEMGLDYFKNFQPRNVQYAALRGQLLLAQKCKLPVIIHCRDAFTELFSLLAEIQPVRVLLHCFTGTLEEAKKAWELGYYTAFTGIITYPSATDLCDVAAVCPLDRLIIESDCPYLSPQSKRGQRNEPAFLRETFEMLTHIRKETPGILEQQLQENTKQLFGL